MAEQITAPGVMDVQRVHLIFKTHLDVGFTDLAVNVVARYFSHYIPQAIETARRLREQGGPDRFIWTTGSWLIYEYLEQASPAERKAMEKAITAGDIVWHGLPFTTHSELMDTSLFRYGLSLSQELDRRFGKRTIAAKMTDVPGHTRGIVPLLAEAGIQFLHIGVNQASRLPDVPPVFVWRDAGGAEVVVMYASSYGDTMVVPGTTQAIAFAHTLDNLGPSSAQEVVESFSRLRRQFPEAEVVASTLDAFASQLAPVKSQLPVAASEIGDTWIHGVGSDPLKVSRFRELCRLRRQWLADGRAQLEARSFAAFSRRLLMIPEHTWGMDEKTYLADYEHYDAAGLRSARRGAKWKTFESSWAEQRGYLDKAIQALGETELAREATRQLEAIKPRRATTRGFSPVTDRSSIFDTAHYKIGFDARHGGIATLVDKATGREWASPRHVLGLFHYETFSSADYDWFYRQYIVNKRAVRPWAVFDFTKPGMGRAAKRHKAYRPQLVGLYRRYDRAAHRFLIELTSPSESSTVYGCPEYLTMEVVLPDDEPVVQIDLQWFIKPACRLPEAIWFSFAPVVSNHQGWRMDKMGEWVSPGEVVRNGNRKLHAVGAGVSYTDHNGQLVIESLDAPLAAPGEPSLLNFNNRQPPLSRGMHFNLYNNVWGTNFPMWYDDDARFRFIIRTSA